MANLTSLPHSIYLKHTVFIDAPASLVFDSIRHLNRYYQQLAVGHRKFDITNGDRLDEGSIIHCEEVAGNQQVIHVYKVEQLTCNQLLYYVSKPSVSYINGNKRRPITSNTHVQFELTAPGADRTVLTTTVVIQFSNALTSLLALLTGTRKLWQAHVEEETTGLKKLIESLPQTACFNPASADTL